MTRLFLLLFLLRCVCSWRMWVPDGAGTPGPRAEHSLLFWNDAAYLFGGRSDDISVEHDPRTYDVKRENGTYVFTTYDGKSVKACAGEASRADCYNVTIGTSHNDLWRYDLNCTRAPDGASPCGWDMWIPDAPWGGCRNYNNTQVCTHPQERYGHAAAIVYEKHAPRALEKLTYPAQLIVYGGASKLCADYCSDMWALNVTQCTLNRTLCKWAEVGVLGRDGPGKRWRAASVNDNDQWIIFGGHRMWHGFAEANTLGNNWNDFSAASQYPFGGFLDDLWVFTWDRRGVEQTVYWDLGAEVEQGNASGTLFGGAPLLKKHELSLGKPVPVTTCSAGQRCLKAGAWTQVLPREQCHNYGDPLNMAAKHRIICTVKWPAKRANAAVAQVYFQAALYLFGGATTEFPYPHVLARGAGPGVHEKAANSRAPYPGQPTLLNDLWRFSWRTGLWEELAPTALGGATPSARQGHALILAGSALVLTGGYSMGSQLNDLWTFNLTMTHWLKQLPFPKPLFPVNCTTDFDPITDVPSAQSRSVWFEPTRGRATDGKWGRASEPMFISGRRRATFGWDGCRDRADGRTDLGNEVSFLQPSFRAYHAAVWSDREKMMLLYGGEAMVVDYLPTPNASYPVATNGDLWAWSSQWCPFDCKGNGACVYGHCYCKDGYYGLDCSNKTCPGDYCRYDTLNHVQTCSHCCAAPFQHYDGNFYVGDAVRKVPCDATHPGEMNGVCNGAGECICAPPFLGADCSISDCWDNCTSADRGYCSVEYPVSRCICNPPYGGANCSLTNCLNNCSWPNGECDLTSGLCTCKKLASPYDKTIPWSAYAGDDCSFVPAFAGASRPATAWTVVALLLALAAAAAARVL
jgi:hypothetical protein